MAVAIIDEVERAGADVTPVDHSAKKLAHVARAEAAKANSPMAGLVR